MATEVTTRTAEQKPRMRVGRSQTQMPQAAPTRPIQTTRRSLSQDSVRANTTVEKAKATTRKPAKKGSSHADVIDRLDFSGVGPMFHHDGPFDACAPSRNRHKTKAPMLAWAGAAEEDKDALANAREIPSQQSPYPSPGIYAPYEAPKKKHDAIAEAWGIHEPEPFEDFSAGGGYSGGGHSEMANGTTSRNATSSRRTKDGRDAREKYKEYLEDTQPPAARRQQTKRSPIPPPQPIFNPEADMDLNTSILPPSPTSPGAPKRTKSLMHRIRKMRDAPNVPSSLDDQTGFGEQDPPSPTSAENGLPQAGQRPTHRSQNSFLGRFGGRRSNSKDLPSPTDEYVYVQDPTSTRRDKSLPAPPTRGRSSPPEAVADGYFDSSAGYVSGGTGIGRRASLLKKVKGVVKGGEK
ncbi:hypothetical protein EW026_g1662 [Hermanssonia centrifuga]|uniref:Uncharacterized protein n=1 Tax=Hermanssonia centrifuga TaxID=98765 RepID=A0A4S4KR96_9APHY|nr:hypothetical protein EW026_g1662 [Hermanssonia centrifuga]